MKGLIFTQFLTMVEKKFSMDLVDEIIEMAELPKSSTSYTKKNGLRLSSCRQWRNCATVNERTSI
jgi:hypothetical protein